MFLVALRIHVSEICRDILEKLGGFHLVYRGQITMKVCLCSFFASHSFTYPPFTLSVLKCLIYWLFLVGIRSSAYIFSHW